MAELKQINVFDILRTNILAGKYADRFPSERALMARYGVTRSSVRAALAKLEAQGVISRKRGSGAYLTAHAQNRASGLFGIIIPDAKKPFYAAMIDGISNAVKNSGGGDYSLLISDIGTGTSVPRSAERLAELCLNKRVTGLFFRPLVTKAGRAATQRILESFRLVRIPVALINGDISEIPEHTGCDIVAAKGYSNATPEVAALLGDIAFRLMLQRLAYPSHPPAEVLLDPPFRSQEDRCHSV